MRRYPAAQVEAERGAAEVASSVSLQRVPTLPMHMTFRVKSSVYDREGYGAPRTATADSREYLTIPLLEARFSEVVKHRRLSSVATYL
jgi:hypothetical protein